MEGLGEQAEDYKDRLRAAWDEAVFQKQCQTEDEIFALMQQCKAIFGQQEEENKRKIIRLPRRLMLLEATQRLHRQQRHMII